MWVRIWCFIVKKWNAIIIVMLHYSLWFFTPRNQCEQITKWQSQQLLVCLSWDLKLKLTFDAMYGVLVTYPTTLEPSWGIRSDQSVSCNVPRVSREAQAGQSQTVCAMTFQSKHDTCETLVVAFVKEPCFWLTYVLLTKQWVLESEFESSSNDVPMVAMDLLQNR